MIELGDWQFYLIGMMHGILIGYFLLTKEIVRKYFKVQDNATIEEGKKNE